MKFKGLWPRVRDEVAHDLTPPKPCSSVAHQLLLSCPKSRVLHPPNRCCQSHTWSGTSRGPPNFSPPRQRHAAQSKYPTPLHCLSSNDWHALMFLQMRFLPSCALSLNPLTFLSSSSLSRSVYPIQHFNNNNNNKGDKKKHQKRRAEYDAHIDRDCPMSSVRRIKKGRERTVCRSAVAAAAHPSHAH